MQSRSEGIIFIRYKNISTIVSDDLIIWWRGRDNEDHRVVMLLVIRGVKAKQKLESRWRTEPKHWYHPQARVSICICNFHHPLITKLWSCSEEFCEFSAFPQNVWKFWLLQFDVFKFWEAIRAGRTATNHEKCQQEETILARLCTVLSVR